ncbi:hypothetical protein pb186bvf_009503 [Paramecium bursaria]
MLSNKQEQEFKSLVKLLEQKDYKKGLKSIEKLAQQTENAQVHSLRAIFLYHNDQQEEGFQLAKASLTKDMKSYFCWHILGLIHKANKNYPDAVKCFLQSLKQGDENPALIRDNANLQLHIRDYEGHLESRHQYVTLKHGFIENWMGLIFALHLTKQYDQAFEYIQSVDKIIAKLPQSLKSVEVNEYKLYQVKLAFDQGDYNKSLKLLHDYQNLITDKVSYHEFEYQIYSKLNQIPDAIKAVQELLVLQPQNWNYYQYLLKLDPQADLTVYKNSLVQGRLLEKYQGEEFKAKFQEFVDPFFKKSMPSLFREIVHLYKDQTKIPIIEQVFQSYLDQQPLIKLWSLMLLAQHNTQIKNYEVGLQQIEEAIIHTPTCHELYLVKAKILKRLGRFLEAYETADKARELDLADRYLNNKAIKYALRANKVYVSHDLIKLFLRDGSNPFELQKVWFEVSTGRTFLRLGYYAAALARFNLIYKAYQEMYEDQLEFYQFSLRRFTLRTLQQNLEQMDQRFDNKYFVQAAGLMLEGLKLIKPTLSDQVEAVQEKKLSVSEKKRLAKEKKQQEEDQKIRNLFLIEGHILNQDQIQKYDLQGTQLVQNLKIQGNWDKLFGQFAQALVHTNLKDKKANFQAFRHLVQYYIDQKKPLLCLRIFNKLRQSETPENKIVNHKYQLLLVKYLNTYKGDQQELINEFVPNSIQKFDEEFWQQVQIVTQLEKALKQQCENILKDQPYDIDEQSDDLDFLEEFPQARKSTKNQFYANDPNKIWQDSQILFYKQQQEAFEQKIVQVEK